MRAVTRALALAFVVVTVLVLSASRAVPAAQASARTPLMGINVSSGAGAASTENAISEAQALGATVVRTEVSWASLEPTGPGELEQQALANTDQFVQDAAAAGLKVIMMVDQTPCWASSAPQALLQTCNPGAPNAAQSWPPSEPSRLATFMAFLASRYGSNLAALEIWNEPDEANQAYFAGPNKPRRYAALVRAAYPAIKRADPSVKVLAGSLVGSNGVFLKALYAAGMKGYYDGLAVHFYTLTLAALRTLHEVQLRHGDHTPLWLDEFGWSTCLATGKVQQDQACVTPTVQAQNLRNTVRSLARTPWVAAAVSYDLRDADHQDFGVLNEQGEPKPAFQTLHEAFTTPFGPIEPVTLRLGVSRGRVRASGTAPVGDYMELDVYTGSVERYRTLFTLNRLNHYSLWLPAALGTKGLRVKVFRYWNGPRSGAQRST